MDGEVWAESVQGKGSTFHFTAWLNRAAAPDMQRIAPVSLIGKKLLVVDDNQTNLDIMHHTFRLSSVQAVCCSSGAEALTQIASAVASGAPFDIGIIDIMMPVMNGFDLARAIRRDFGESLPLIAFSSSAISQSQQCRDAGFNGFLFKPISRIKLFTMMEMLLGRAAHAPAAPGDQTPDIVTQYTMREEGKYNTTILIAEDNPINQKLAVTMLTKAGYNVEVAENGWQVIEKYTAEPGRYDLILMDVQMPELSGIDATRLLRKQNFHSIPIIAMTAEAMKGDREKCIEAGMNDYLAKPIKREEVFEMVKRWLFERSLTLAAAELAGSNPKAPETPPADR